MNTRQYAETGCNTEGDLEKLYKKQIVKLLEENEHLEEDIRFN
jgi:hypothetical protein